MRKFALLFSLILVACGGGGGSNPQPVQPLKTFTEVINALSIPTPYDISQVTNIQSIDVNHDGKVDVKDAVAAVAKVEEVVVTEVKKAATKAKKVAAYALEASEGDIEFKDGRFSVAGTDKSLVFGEVALQAYIAHKFNGQDLEPGLKEGAFYDPTNFTFPSGVHICEVEIDPALGTLEIVHYAAVDDVGLAVNPMIVHGQVHGGIVQGVGQALLEQCFYDENSGQLITGSFMDYAMPRADNFPFFDAEFTEVPSTTHPLGMRPAGEGGTTPALGVAINAVVNALSDYGVKHIEMPATPERIWRAIHQKQ